MVPRVFFVVIGVVAVGACSGAPQAPSSIGLPEPVSQTVGPAATSFVGIYAAELSLPACLGLPRAERVRRYTARIEPDENAGVYVVTLSDAMFLDALPSRFHPVPMTPNQFLAFHDAHSVSFALWADWESSFGGRIIERVASGQWIDIQGDLTGRLGADAITASGTGQVKYCSAATPSLYCKNGSWVTCDTTLTLTLVPE
jgi:hypothetical protein